MLTEKQKQAFRDYLSRLNANSADDLTNRLLKGTERDQFEEFVIAHTELTKPTMIYYLQKMAPELPVKGSAADTIRVVIDKLDEYIGVNVTA
jgi:hypothetical protein